MEKSSYEMNLDDWEILSNDGFLIDFHHYDHQGPASTKPQLDPDADYFICPSPRARRIVGAAESLDDSNCINQGIRIPVQLNQKRRKNNEDEEKVKEVIMVPTIVEINKFEAVIDELEKIKPPSLNKSVGGDQEMVLSQQVFFKKPKGSDVFDMKIDSPRAIKPQYDAGSIQFEEKEEATGDPEGESKDHNEVDHQITPNIWRWRFNGIGTLCSMGVAAATIFIFILGSHQKHKHHHGRLKFQICGADDHRRIKQVVHHASKLNQAFQAVRGVPAAGAQVTFGGYYEGL